MFKNELIPLFKSFSEEEVRKFRSFVSSPYFNKNKKAVTLYDELIKSYPEFDSPEDSGLNREKLFSRLYPNSAFKDSTLRSLSFRLLQLAEKFLVMEKYEKDSFASSVCLLEDLNFRGLEKLAKRSIKKISSEVSKANAMDGDWLFTNYLFEIHKHNHLVHFYKLTNRERAKNYIIPFEKSVLLLSLYYMTELTSDYVNLLIILDKYDISEEPSYITQLFDRIDFRRYYQIFKGTEFDFVFELYISLIEMFKDIEDEKKYFSYKDLVMRYMPRMNRNEISVHYSKLLASCVLRGKQKSVSGKLKKENFNIQRNFIENGYYKTSRVKYIPYGLFRSTLSAALESKEYGWAEKFIKTQIRNVSPDQRGNMQNHAYAHYYFEKGEFQKSLSYVNKGSIDFYLFKYDLKNLKLRIYYNLKYFDNALQLIHSYEEQLKNDELITPATKTKHRHFLAAMKKLINHKLDKAQIDTDSLRRKISFDENFMCKDWLLKEVEKCGR